MADFSKRMVSTSSLQDIEWGDEELYWRGEYARRPYVRADRGFPHYEPAFRYGVASASRLRGRKWIDVESELARGWVGARGNSQTPWEEIKGAVRDAWDRVVARFGSASGSS